MSCGLSLRAGLPLALIASLISSIGGFALAAEEPGAAGKQSAKEQPAPSLAEAYRAVQARGPFFQADLPAEFDDEREAVWSISRVRCSPPGGGGRCVAICPAGRLLAVGTKDGDVSLFAAQETSGDREDEPRSALAKFSDHGSEVRSLAFSADGKRLASGDDKGRVIVRDLAKGTILARIESPDNWTSQLSFSPDGELLAASTGIFELASAKLLWRCHGTLAAWTPDSQTLLVPTADAIEFVEARTGELRRTIPGPGRHFTAVAVSPDGRQVAAVTRSPGHHLQLYAYASGALEHSLVLDEHARPRYLGTGKFLVTSGDRGTDFWDPATGKRLCHHSCALKAFSADGKLAATEGEYASVYDISLLLNMPFMRAVAWLNLRNCRTRIQRDVLVVRPEITPFNLHGLAELHVPLAIRARGLEPNFRALGIVAANLEVRELECQARTVTDPTIEQLAKLPQLRVLKLYDAQNLTDVSVQAIAQKTELKELHLTGCQASEEALSKLAALEQLEDLELGAKNLTDRALGAVAGMTRLRRLKLSSGRLSGEGLRHLAGMKQLESLELTGLTELRDAGFARLPTLPQLKRLHVIDCPQLGAGALETIGRQVQLESLVLDYCERIPSEGFVHLRGLKNLAELSMDGCTAMTGVGLETLAAFPKITALDLMLTGVNDAGLASVAKIPQLEKLGLSPHVSDAGLKALSAMPRLEAVDHDGLPLVLGPGMFALAKARRLRELNLRDTRVDDSGLAGIQELSDLEYLTLPVHVTDKGLAPLSTLTNLKWLDLLGTAITDAGLKHLSGLYDLRYLDVSSTEVTDEGLIHLRALPHLKLQHNHTKITDQEVTMLALGADKYLQELRHFQLDVRGADEITGIHFSPDGKTLACATGDYGSSGALHVLDYPTMQQRFVRRYPGKFQDTPSVSFLPDSQSFITQGGPQELIRFDVRSGEFQETYSLEKLKQSYPQFWLVPGGKQIVLNYSALLLVGPFPPADRWTEIDGAYGRRRFAVDADGKWLFCGDGEARTVLWNLRENKQQAAWDDQGKGLYALAVARDRKWLAAANLAARLMVRDGHSGRKMWESREECYHLLFSADNRSLIYVPHDRSRVVIVDAATGNHIHTWKSGDSNFSSLALTPDGKNIITGEQQGMLRFWAMPSGAPKSGTDVVRPRPNFPWWKNPDEIFGEPRPRDRERPAR